MDISDDKGVSAAGPKMSGKGEVYFLVYASVPAELAVDPAELLRLLEVSRRNNRRLDVTGMLLYKEGLFLQMLEGEESVVKQLYTKISLDARHHSLAVVVDGRTDRRLFSDWSMSFRNLEDPALAQTPGFSQFMNSAGQLDHLGDDPEGCLRLFRLFHDTM